MDQVNVQTLEPGVDLSLWGMFLQADFIIQAVVISLILASIWCWTIIFNKYFKLRRLAASADNFEEGFWSGNELDKLFDRLGSRPQDPLASTFSAAMQEWRRSMANNRRRTETFKASLQQRIERVMQTTADREMEALESQMTFLASVGSTAPFIGLFGTVWGIMNSFQGIASSQSTNLAVVAPGIAEALFATALGLFAAIPAVLAYNILSRDINNYYGRLENFMNEFTTILSRQLDEAA